MGQTIQIRDADVVGDVLLVSTDRSFTGQDGESLHPRRPIGPGAIFPAQLAARLFESDPSIDHVYVMSNVLSIRRSEGWDDVVGRFGPRRGGVILPLLRGRRTSS